MSLLLVFGGITPVATLTWWVGWGCWPDALVPLLVAFPYGWLGLPEGGVRIARGRNRSPCKTWPQSPRMFFLYPVGQSKSQGQP